MIWRGFSVGASWWRRFSTGNRKLTTLSPRTLIRGGNSFSTAKYANPANEPCRTPAVARASRLDRNRSFAPRVIASEARQSPHFHGFPTLSPRTLISAGTDDCRLFLRHGFTRMNADFPWKMHLAPARSPSLRAVGHLAVNCSQ